MNAIIYHRVDWDGYTAAAVALRAFPQADILGWNYRDPIPDVSHYDRVVLVDLTIYSVNPDGTRDFSWMEENRSKLIWLDHHPVINEVPGSFDGIQKEGIGACWLTWTYFHTVYGVSCNTEHIRLAATYDVFRKDGKLCSWEDAWAYQLFLNSFGPGWKPDCGDRSKDLVAVATDLIEEMDLTPQLQKGYSLEALRAKKEKDTFEKHAWEIEIDNHRGWLVDSKEQPSLIVKDHSDAGDGDFFIIYSDDKKSTEGNYIVSIRVPESSDFDAIAFAKAHGGGGHPKACGCQISETEMISLFIQLL